MQTGMIGGNPAQQPAERQLMFVGNPGSTAIPTKTPVSFIMNGTRDGFDVEIPSDAGAAQATTLFAGITAEEIPAGATRTVVVFGLVDDVVVIRATRAASTDSFASAPALAIGDQLIVNTVGDGMSRSGAGAANANNGFCAAAETIASVASAASTTSNTSLLVTTAVKAFVRAM